MRTLTLVVLSLVGLALVADNAEAGLRKRNRGGCHQASSCNSCAAPAPSCGGCAAAAPACGSCAAATAPACGGCALAATAAPAVTVAPAGAVVPASATTPVVAGASPMPMTPVVDANTTYTSSNVRARRGIFRR